MTDTPSPDETAVEAADTRRIAEIQHDPQLSAADRMDEMANEVAAEAAAEDEGQSPGA